MRAFTLLLVLALTAGSAEAARVRRLPLAEIRDRAVAVVLCEVIARSSRVDEDGRMVWTDYRLRVAESLRGELVGPEITLTFAGGVAGGLDIGIAGAPRLVAGKRYVIFIDDTDSVAVPAIGWGQGIYALESQAGSSDEILVSADGEALEIGGGGELVRRSIRPSGDERRRLVVKRRYNGNGSVIRGPRSASTSQVSGRRYATLRDLRLFLRAQVPEREMKVQQR